MISFPVNFVSVVGRDFQWARTTWCRTSIFSALFASIFFLGCLPLHAAEVGGPVTCYDFANQPKVEARFVREHKEVNFGDCQVVYFDRYTDKIWIAGGDPKGIHDIDTYNAAHGHKDWTAAIVGSKVLLSGSILVVNVGPPSQDTQNRCTSLDWKVVTQAKESANVLIFGPADFGPGTCTSSQYLIALPVHVLWAEVTGFERKKDPTRKPPAPYADKPATDCASQVRLCDRDDWPSSWFYKTRYVYNLASQPGSSQGTISYSPVIGGGTGSPKLTYDMQLSSAAQVGPGWLGAPLTFEKDSNPAANLDALLAGVSYDLRPVIDPNFKTTSHFSLRKPQFQLRSLVEFAPTKSLPSGTHDLNLVEGETARLPLVFNFNRQPSALVLTPLLGLEEGFHIQTHLAEGDHIFRGLAGWDVSYLWPYSLLHNLLGDKPITLAFSYRVRWVASPEPCLVVRTTKDRIPRSTILAERGSNHYGDRVADLQGTDSDAKRPSGSAKCGGLDTGFEDSKRHGRSSPPLARHRGFQESDGDCRRRTVSVSERSESDRTSQKTQDRLDENSATGKDSLFSDLRPALCLRHKAERRRRSRRMGNAAAPPERRASLQEVFPDEVADEARSPGEAQPSSERNGTGGGGRCFFDRSIVHRGGPMTHSCTVRAQCARIMERSGRGDFSNSFAIRKKLVDVTGFEPATPCLQSRCSPS